MKETESRDWGRDVSDLLEDAALIHESEGRGALAKHHRRVARALHPAQQE